MVVKISTGLQGGTEHNKGAQGFDVQEWTQETPGEHPNMQNEL
jgi:hypothetical protein